MSLWNRVASQFGKPSGLLGHLAGFIMSRRQSNVERNAHAIELLELKLSDNFLEIGFGPGVVIEKVAGLITVGKIFGIDHSELMVKTATRRNLKAIKDGRVKLVCASISDKPRFGTVLDKVLDVNSFQFWENQVESLKSLREQMSKKAVLVIVHQPRQPGATRRETELCGKDFSEKMKMAGFEIKRIEIQEAKPVPVVNIIGVNGQP